MNKQPERYDAFLSYSNAADTSLAQALQRALQQFACPWYRLRRLQVYRDKTDLSLTPELWPSIEKGLSESRYLILLASPKAAASKWVQREIAWWLEHRSQATLLLVLTEGEVTWDPQQGAFHEVQSPSLPELIHAGWKDQPMWVDMRWARSRNDLSLRYPQFLDAVGDIAATLLDRPKRDLVGEDVKRHRQTIRLAWFVASVILLLACGASVAAWVANTQRMLANQREVRAMQAENAAIEERNRAMKAERAERSGRLLAEAEPLIEEDPLQAAEKLAEVFRLEDTPRVEQVARQWQERRLRWVLRENSGSILGAAWSTDGKWFATAEAVGQMVRLWSTDGWQVTRAVSMGFPPWTVAFSPQGDRLAAAGDGGVLVWSRETGRPLWGYKTEEDFSTLMWSPDSSFIIVGSKEGRVLRLRSADGMPTTDYVLPSKLVTEVAISGDGRFIAAASSAKQISVFRVEKSHAIHTLKIDEEPSSVAWSGKELVAALGDGRLMSWRPGDHAPSFSMPGHAAPLRRLVVTNSMVAAGAVDGTILFRHLPDGAVPWPDFRAADAVEGLAYDYRDGRWWIASWSGTEPRTRIHEPDRRASRPILKKDIFLGLHAAAFNQDGTKLAFGGQSGMLFSTKLPSKDGQKNQQRWGSCEGHGDTINSIDFSSDGTRLVSGGRDATVRLWNTRETCQMVSASKPLPGPVTGVCFRAKEQEIAASVATGGLYRFSVPQLAGPTPTPAADLAAVVALACDPQGHIAVYTSTQLLGIGDLAQHAAWRWFPIENGGVSLISWDAQGRFVTLGDNRGYLTRMESNTGQIRWSRVIDHGGITGLSISPNGQRIVAMGPDGAVTLLSAESGSVRARFPTDLKIGSVAWHPAGKLIVVAGVGAGPLVEMDMPERDDIIKDLDDYIAWGQAQKTAMAAPPPQRGYLGLKVELSQAGLRIANVLPAGPAARAGLLPGAVITQIDGRVTAGLSQAEATVILDGPAGSTTTLGYRHEGVSPSRTITLLRVYSESLRSP